jgi:hypothetical protein
MKGKIMEEDYINIGKIDIKKFKKISEEILTDEVILTSERFKHIIERHKDDFELYFKNIKDVLEKPDIILEDLKNENTAMMIKHIEETNLNIIIKLVIEQDEVHTKNSIMTFYRVRDKNVRRLKEKNKIIYKKE